MEPAVSPKAFRDVGHRLEECMQQYPESEGTSAVGRALHKRSFSKWNVFIGTGQVYMC